MTKNLYKNTMQFPVSLVPSEIIWISSLGGDQTSAQIANASGKLPSDCGDIGGMITCVWCHLPDVLSLTTKGQSKKIIIYGVLFFFLLISSWVDNIPKSKLCCMTVISTTMVFLIAVRTEPLVLTYFYVQIPMAFESGSDFLNRCAYALWDNRHEGLCYKHSRIRFVRITIFNLIGAVLIAVAG